MSLRGCKLTLLAAVVAGDPKSFGHATALRGPRQPAREPPGAAGDSEPRGERGGHGNDGTQRACTLSDDAMFELVSKFRGREWALAADHDAAKGAGEERAGRFVLTMGAGQTEGSIDEGGEGKETGSAAAAAAAAVAAAA